MNHCFTWFHFYPAPPEHCCSVAGACWGGGARGKGGSVSLGVVSEGGEVSDSRGGHGDAERILKDNQSCFSLKNFPLKWKLLVRKNLRNWRQTNCVLILSSVSHLDIGLYSVSLISQLSTETEILTERQIYSLAWPPVKTNKVRNTAGWLLPATGLSELPRTLETLRRLFVGFPGVERNRRLAWPGLSPGAALVRWLYLYLIYPGGVWRYWRVFLDFMTS